MDATRRNNLVFRAIAALLGGTSIVILALGDSLPAYFVWIVAAAGLVCAAVVLYISYGHRAIFGRSEHVNLEFRHEVERYLNEVAGASHRGGRTRAEKETIDRTEADRPEPRSAEPRPPVSAASTGDILGKLTENIEVLAGYREDLVALLQLHRRLADPHTKPVEREEVRREIARLEKTVALPFLLEDSEAVQAELQNLVEDLRRWLRHGAAREAGDDDNWSPVDLHGRIEMALERLPKERARGCWFERHFGEVPLILTRPAGLNEALHLIFDYFSETVGGGQAIHIRTAQRGEFAWIGVGSAPSDTSPGTTTMDERIQSATRIWDDLGADVVVGDTEVRILVPLHGPMHLFHEEVGESADEKTT